MEKPKLKHIPVLLNETLEGLGLRPGLNVVDCTVGAGGHAAAILERTSPNGRLLGMDLDEATLETAQRNLSRFGSRAMLVRANYRNADQVLLSNSFGSFQAALLDLGYSSIEIDDPTRGFSFREDGPLDMRYDRGQELTAAALVNSSSEDELARIITEYGEDRAARRIARAIVAERRKGRIVSTARLADAIARAVKRGSGGAGKRIHPATLTFQALRIAVNDELGSVQEGLSKLIAGIDAGGRVAAISFHSLEDRIVKRTFREAEAQGLVRVLNKKPITPSDEEIRANPRSRSAKLRVAIKAG